MKISVFAVLLGHMPLREAAAYLAGLGVQGLEIGTGGYPGKGHCNPEALLADPAQLLEFRKVFADYGLEIAALSCHGNPVHPDPAVAASYQTDWENTLRLAQALGVTRVVGFSGCPGGGPNETVPNWVTCAWPEDYAKILDYQWHSVLLPYWQKAAIQAKNHGVTHVALEMHPGFCVYNPETMLRLREVAGPVIGANVDPSHLFWQGIDPAAAIALLGEAVHFFHAKDTAIHPINCAKFGVLDTKSYLDEANRAWIFRTLGYGHSELVWREIFSALRMAGYDGFVSIEHEDSLMSRREGLEKGVAFLKQNLVFDPCDAAHWA